MSEDRTTGGAPPDAAPTDAAPDAAVDADATRAYALSPTAVSPQDDDATAPASRRSEAAAGDDTRARPTAQADGPRWASGTSASTTAGSSPVTGAAGAGAPTTVLPTAGSRPPRPTPPRPDRPVGEPRSAARPQTRPAGRRRARLVVQRVDAWSVFLFSLVASICLGVVLFVAVTALYAALSSLGVLGSLNGLLGEVAGSGTGEEVVEPFITAGRVLGATAVLAAVDVVLLTALATLGALLYNLCASLTGGIEVQLGERE